MGRYARTVVLNSEGVSSRTFAVLVPGEPYVNVWRNLYRLSCVEGVLDEFPYRREDRPSRVREAYYLLVSVEEVSWADLLERLRYGSIPPFTLGPSHGQRLTRELSKGQIIYFRRLP